MRKTLFYQPLDGYCYNSDTIFLYHFIKQFAPKGRLLDVGSGSGVLGILLAKQFPIALHAIEVQEKMAHFTRLNAKVNQLDITLKEGDFLQTAWEEKFDFIVSNPPFYHSNVIKSTKENLRIARYIDHLPPKAFFKMVNSLLNPRGYFIFCYDSKQIMQIMGYLHEFKLVVEVMKFVHPKPNKEASLVMIACRKGSKSLLKVQEPLIVFKEGVFTQEVESIYEDANTHTIKGVL